MSDSLTKLRASTKLLFERMESDSSSFSKKLAEKGGRELTRMLELMAEDRPDGFLARVVMSASSPSDNPILDAVRRELDMNTFDRAVMVCRELLRRNVKLT